MNSARGNQKNVGFGVQNNRAGRGHIGQNFWWCGVQFDDDGVGSDAGAGFTNRIDANNCPRVSFVREGVKGDSRLKSRLDFGDVDLGKV